MFTLWYLVLGYKEYNRGYRNATPSQLSNNEKASNEKQSKVVNPEPVKKPDTKNEVPEIRPTEPAKIPERPKAQEPKTTEPMKIPERPKAQEPKPMEPPKMPERPKAQDPKPMEPPKMPERPKAQDPKPVEPMKIPERPKAQEPKPVELPKMPESPKAQEPKPVEPPKMPERPKAQDPKPMEPAMVPENPKPAFPKRESPEAGKPTPGSNVLPGSGAEVPESFRPDVPLRGPAGKANPSDKTFGRVEEQGDFLANKRKRQGSPEEISREDEMLGRRTGGPAGVNGAGPKQGRMNPKDLSYGYNTKNNNDRGRKSDSKKGERSVPSSQGSLDGGEKEF